MRIFFKHSTLKLSKVWISLAVQWLRFSTPNTGDIGLIPGWGKFSCCMNKQKRKKTKKSIKTFNYHIFLEFYKYLTYIRTYLHKSSTGQSEQSFFNLGDFLI